MSAHPDETAVPAEVVLLEPSGGDLWVVGQWQGVTLKGKAAPGTSLAPGTRAYFRIPPDGLYFFDAGSGRRRRGRL